MSGPPAFIPPATYAWDADSNPINLNGVGLTYDALDREVEIASGSTYTQVLYGPTGKLGLMNGQTANRIRVPLPGGSTAELVGSTGGTKDTLHSDWLGSSRLSTNYGGHTVAYDASYAPYGENYDGWGSSAYDLDFTGQFQDTLSGLYDFPYREYNPVQGRWISPDRAGLSAVDPSNPQSWNRYAYVLNNPLSNTDPTGLYCDYSDHDDPNSGFDPSQFDYDSNSNECASNQGQWVDDAYTQNGADMERRPQYAVPGSATTDITQAPTVTDDYYFLKMWKLGVGPPSISYGPNDGMTKQLAASRPAQQIRAQYIKGGCKDPDPKCPYSSGHGAGVWGIISLNPALAQVGGFVESTSTTGDTTTFTITNTAGQASWSGATTIKGGIPGMRSDGTTDNPYGPDGPRHNIDQTFTWTEKGLCGS